MRLKFYPAWYVGDHHKTPWLTHKIAGHGSKVDISSTLMDDGVRVYSVYLFSSENVLQYSSIVTVVACT